MVEDSYCLQCIVFDDDRQRVFSAVQSRLKPGGYYLVSTAILDEEHEKTIESRTVKDPSTGVTYTEYGAGLIDLDTGVVLRPFPAEAGNSPDARIIAGQRYLPHRRHLRPAALEAELEAAGFSVLFRTEHHAGSLVCRSRDG